jgi:predicted nuclease with TOPRIM domain
MGKTSIRLSTELSRKLLNEARRRGQASGENVTVSEVIRGCIVENFAPLSLKVRGESAAVAEIKDEVSQLKESYAQLSGDLQSLVKKLTELFPLIATREQVESLTDGIAVVINRLQGR